MTERDRARIRVLPRSGRDEVGGMRDGALLVRVAAPAVDGAANEAATRLLAKALDVPARALRIEQGVRSRSKLVSMPAGAAARVARLMQGAIR